MLSWAPSVAPMSLDSRYTILRKIADGGTAEIFLAKQHGAQGFEKSVVLKRIFTTFYADPQFRHMLVDEAHVAMSLNHSNIVQVLDLGEAEGRYFLALELVDGWTLDRILRRSKAAGVPFPPALALYLTAEVCRALAYAHAKRRADGEPLGIVHRDVSPHNVLVSEQGEIKVTDFGIAKAQTRREKSVGNLIKGKIAFMSPEQASGEPLDARSDLFSVGTMLYVMITRRHPFDAPTDYEALMLVKASDFVPPETARPGLNPELYRVMRKAMAKSPADRYQKAEDMLVDVEQVMRLAFRPVGQTELQRWLADLSTKDGVPNLTREAPAEPPASQSTVGPLRAGEGQESGLVLSLEDDAVEVNPAVGGERRPPPPPGATEVMTHAPAFMAQDRPWFQRRGLQIAGGAVVIGLLLVLAVRTAVHDREPPARHAAGPPPATATTPPPVPAAEPVPAAAPAPDQIPPAPAAVAPAPAADDKVATAEPRPPAVPAPGPAPAAVERPDTDHDESPPATPAKTAAKPKRPQVAVALRSDPDGSQVASGNHVFGTTPLTTKLRPGTTYEFTFTKSGYAPTVKKYRLDTEEPQTLRVSLKKVEPAKPAPSAAPKPPQAKPAPSQRTAPAQAKKSWFGR